MFELGKLLKPALVAGMLMSPMAASATVVHVSDNIYTGSLEADENLGTLDLAVGNVTFSGIAGGATGGLNFGVKHSGGVGGTTGALQLLIDVSGSSFTVDVASFDGAALVFGPVIGGIAAVLSANFDSATDVVIFDFAFSGAAISDSIQVSLSPVPVPAAGFLLLGALGGLGFMGRRRKKAA